MARLALGAKWGARAPSVLAPMEALPEPRSFSFSNEANAMEPIPVAQRPKNWRRVIVRRCSWLSSLKRSLMRPGLSIRNCQIFQDDFRYALRTKQLSGIKYLDTNEFLTFSDVQRDFIVEPNSAAFVLAFDQANIQSVDFRIVADSHY